MSSQQVIGKRGDIFDTLTAIDRGSFAHDLEDACKEVVQECVGEMKKGKVIIEMTFDPDAKTDAMRVSAKITKKMPEKPTKASIFYPTPEGNLTRMDPRQALLRGTEAEYAPPRRTDYDPSTGELKS